MQIIDPDGDVIIVLPDSSGEGSPRKKQKLSDSETTERAVRFRASSKHLSLASGYFKARLGRRWHEGKELASTGSAEVLVDSPGCDSTTLEIIMDILHLRTRKVPKQIGFDILLNIALATDYLQCHEAVEPYGYRWLQDLAPRMQNRFSSSTKCWMFMAHVYKRNCLFRICTRLAQQEANGPFDSGCLPFPAFIKGTYLITLLFICGNPQ